MAFRQATGHHDRSDLPGLLQFEHFADDTERFLPGRFDEPASVDDDDVRTLGIGLERVTVLSELAEHPLGIDEVLRTTEADERIGTLSLRSVDRFGGEGQRTRFLHGGHTDSCFV